MKKSFNCKTTKRATVLLLAVLVLALALFTSSCGSSNKAAYDTVAPEELKDANTYYDSAESEMGSYNGGFDGELLAGETEITEEINSDNSESDTPTEQTTRKIIYSSWANLQTKEYDKSVSALMALCNEYGAYFESSANHGNRLDYQAERSAEYVIRIPVTNYQAFLGKVGNIGTIVENGENNEDITEKYIDIEARLSSAQLREERVLVLLDNAAMLDDVLALERELADIRYEIETLTGSLRKYDSLVSYATLRLNIDEVVEYSAPGIVPKTFGERVAQNFRDGWRDFVGFWQSVAIALSYGIFAIATWIIIICVIIVITVLSKKASKKKAKRFAEKYAANIMPSPQTPQTNATAGSGTDNRPQNTNTKQ